MLYACMYETCGSLCKVMNFVSQLTQITIFKVASDVTNHYQFTYLPWQHVTTLLQDSSYGEPQ